MLKQRRSSFFINLKLIPFIFISTPCFCLDEPETTTTIGYPNSIYTGGMLVTVDIYTPPDISPDIRPPLATPNGDKQPTSKAEECNNRKKRDEKFYRACLSTALSRYGKFLNYCRGVSDESITITLANILGIELSRTYSSHAQCLADADLYHKESIDKCENGYIEAKQSTEDSCQKK